MRLLVFSFRGNISERVLNLLNIPCLKYKLGSSQKEIEKLMNHLEEAKPDFIIGLGMYTGKDCDKLRIETQCNPKFRNRTLYFPQLLINPFLTPLMHSKFAKGIGNSYCNFVSLKIKNSNLASNYTFIHIPKDFLERDAANEVEEMWKKFSIFILSQLV